MEVEITSESMTSDELQDALTAHVVDDGVTFEQRTPQYRTGIEVAVVVALITGGGAALSAVVTGLFTLAAASRTTGKKIVIRGREGSIEIPADTPAEDIPKLIELAREFDRPVVELP